MSNINEYTPADTVEEDFVNLVRLELNDIKNTFFKIGFRLREANNNRYYKKLGFNTIEECAEALFGFKKTTTYDLMAIAEQFHDPKAPMHLAEYYKKFSQSQLVILSQVRTFRKEFIKIARPEDTVEKFKTAKKYWNGICIAGARTNSKTLDEFISVCEEYKAKEHNSLSEKDFKTLDKIINNNLLSKANEEFQTSGKEVPDVELSSENSGYPEKEENSVIEISKNEYEDKTEELPDEKLESVSFNKIEQDIEKYMADKIDFMEYRISFGGDKKTPGVRVVPSVMAEFFTHRFYEYINKNRTEVKNAIQNIVANKASQFDYQINLCGRKQPINAFCGNVSNWILDALLKDYLQRQEEYKNSKKRGKK